MVYGSVLYYVTGVNYIQDKPCLK